MLAFIFMNSRVLQRLQAKDPDVALVLGLGETQPVRWKDLSEDQLLTFENNFLEFNTNHEEEAAAVVAEFSHEYLPELVDDQDEVMELVD
jgi:membrane-bound lytic murein transglycosylase MltF